MSTVIIILGVFVVFSVIAFLGAWWFVGGAFKLHPDRRDLRKTQPVRIKIMTEDDYLRRKGDYRNN